MKYPFVALMRCMVATAKWQVASSRRLSISSLSMFCHNAAEMNAHVPQSLAAAAELEGIMAVEHQMVSPQHNGVMISLVQDALLSIFLLTRSESYAVHPELFADCVCAARYELQGLRGSSGRDLMSVCLPASLSVPGIVENGRVVAPLDKKAVRKIVHAVWIDFGPERCMQLVSDWQRVLNRWQQSFAFSVGLEVKCFVRPYGIRIDRMMLR